MRNFLPKQYKKTTKLKKTSEKVLTKINPRTYRVTGTAKNPKAKPKASLRKSKSRR